MCVPIMPCIILLVTQHVFCCCVAVSCSSSGVVEHKYMFSACVVVGKAQVASSKHHGLVKMHDVTKPYQLIALDCSTLIG